MLTLLPCRQLAAQLLPPERSEPGKIHTHPPVNALPFLPAQYRSILNIESLLRIVRQLIRPMGAQAQPVLVIDDALVPLEAPFSPVIKPLLHLARMHKELQVPLLELALAEQEVPRRNLVAESLPDLPDTERNLHT